MARVGLVGKGDWGIGLLLSRKPAPRFRATTSRSDGWKSRASPACRPQPELIGGDPWPDGSAVCPKSNNALTWSRGMGVLDCAHPVGRYGISK